MKNDSDSQSEKKRKYPTILLIITSVYGLLYLSLFIIENFIFIPENFNPYNLENSIVKLAFVIFLIGYYMSWKNERIAGIVFIFWWGIWWYLGLFIFEHEEWAGVVMGFPVFIFGILFIVSWYRKRVRSNTLNNVNKSERPIP